MRSDKYNRMIRQFNGHKGSITTAAVLDGMPETLLDRLTGAQLGDVMSAVNAAYHRGHAAAGTEIVDDCVHVRDKLIPLAAIDAIAITEDTETYLKDAHGRTAVCSYCDTVGRPVDTSRARAVNGRGYCYKERVTTRKYEMSYSETL